MRSNNGSHNKVMTVLLIAIIGSTVLAATQMQEAFAVVNGLPTVNPIPDQTVDELSFLTFNVTAADPDGQSLTFVLQNAPYGASINSTTGLFIWTPSEEQGPGVYHINVVVSDGIVISSGTVMIIVNDVGGGGHGDGKKSSAQITQQDISSTDLGATNLFAAPTNIPLDGTTSLIQESDAVNNGKLMALTVTEPDGDVCAATGLGLDIPSSGLSKQYPTDFSLVMDGGDGLCDTGDVGPFQAESHVSTKSGVVQNSAQFETDSPFVLPESPVGLIALMGSTLAVFGAFMAIKGRTAKI
jgi:hypothetical protein